MSKIESFLKSVSFKDLENWSVQYLLETSFSYNKIYPLLKIGSFLARNKTQVIIQDDIEYKRVTIKINNGGIFLRDKKIGKEIRTKKQFVIRKGQFLLSKIDARNGAFGVVTDEVDGAIITGNFWTFDVDYTQINPHFLSLITTTKEFIRFCANASNGTTNRHYLQEEAFLNVKIPLPSLQQQEEILKKYNDKIELAKQQEQEAKKIEESIEEYLFKELGIEKIEAKKEKSGLQFVEFKDIDRWDTQYLIGNISYIKSKYNLELFSNVITCFNKDKKGNSLRINSKNFPEDKFLYIGMEHIEKETGILLEQNIVSGKEIKSQTLRVPRGFLLYGKLRPYLNKYWINDIEKDNIICSSEFFVFDIDESIDKLYFKYCLSSSFIQQQISDKTSGARMPRINEDIFMNLKFPLPPLNIQEKIANEISKRKEKIKQLKQKAQKNREEAIKEFKREIFDEA